MTNISDLLPDKISDEEAYDLVNFIMNLALELESRYLLKYGVMLMIMILNILIIFKINLMINCRFKNVDVYLRAL